MIIGNDRDTTTHKKKLGSDIAWNPSFLHRLQHNRSLETNFFASLSMCATNRKACRRRVNYVVGHGYIIYINIYIIIHCTCVQADSQLKIRYRGCFTALETRRENLKSGWVTWRAFFDEIDHWFADNQIIQYKNNCPPHSVCYSRHKMNKTSML